MILDFIKMNGAGNDFVVIDARNQGAEDSGQWSGELSAEQVRRISARDNQITTVTKNFNGKPPILGCDQLLVLRPSTKADVFMQIYNADGGEVDACGNATRCVAKLVIKELDKNHVTIETNAGLLYCEGENKDDAVVTVNMGKPKLDWKDIPLSEPMDTLHLNISEGELHDPVGVSMGNPHAVFFVENIRNVDLTKIGSKLEHYPIFPQRANIGVAQIELVDDAGDISMSLRVWERGAGETKSCGTGACAALVAAHRRGLGGRTASIATKGGILEVEWDANDNVLLRGLVKTEFQGMVDI
jgi:diaminopimelate epimerase